MPHKKFGPDRFSRFDVYWIQTNRHPDRQTNRQAKFLYRYLFFIGFYTIIPIFHWVLYQHTYFLLGFYTIIHIFHWVLYYFTYFSKGLILLYLLFIGFYTILPIFIGFYTIILIFHWVLYYFTYFSLRSLATIVN